MPAPPRPARLLAAACLLLAACADPAVQRSTETITAIAVGQAADVSARTIAQSMARSGFTRDEILEHGPALRRALATQGGAQARNRQGAVVSLFSVREGRLYVTSQQGGTFVLDL